jgi:hypothetical protein
MNRHLLNAAVTLLVLLASSGAMSALNAQTLFTENLCGAGTTWMSLQSESVIMTAEQLCAAIGPTAVSVAEFYPDGTARYTYDCTLATTPPCTSSTGTFPEPGCTTSTCFCVDPGEGFEVVTSGPAVVAIDGCDSFVPINIPIGGPLIGSNGSLVSVPFNTTLQTFGDLGLYFGLPTRLGSMGRVTGIDCATQSVRTCSVGTAICNSIPLVPGQAYRLESPVAGIYGGTNPVACVPPSPAPGQCAVQNLLVTAIGNDNQIDWTAPAAGCLLPLDYEIARFDLDCLTHYCKHCASCTITGTVSSPITTFTDLSAPSNVGYLVRVVNGTWNESGGGCVNLDLLFAPGCP